MNNELYHHGIKGQKWGVRRYQNKDGSLTPAGKLHVSELHGKLQQVNDGYILKKGTVVQRISDVKEKNARDYAFVSFTSHDNKFYDKNMSENLKFFYEGEGEEATIYKNRYQINKDLHMPTKKIARDTFYEIYKEETEDIIKAMGEAARFVEMTRHPLTYQFKAANFGGDYTKAYNAAVEHFEGRYGKMTIDELKNEGYYDFINSISDNKYYRDRFISKLKNKGYNAVIDENDAGGHGTYGYSEKEIAKCPVIVFDASDTMDKVSSRRIH